MVLNLSSATTVPRMAVIIASSVLLCWPHRDDWKLVFMKDDDLGVETEMVV